MAVPYLWSEISHKVVEGVAQAIPERILAHYRRADHQPQRVEGDLTVVPIGVGHGRGLQDTVVVDGGHHIGLRRRQRIPDGLHQQGVPIRL